VALSPQRHKVVRRFIVAFAQPFAASLLYLLPASRAPALTAADFHAAAAAGAVPVRFWLASRGMSLTALLRPVWLLALAISVMPERSLPFFLAHADAIEAVAFTVFNAPVQLMRTDAYVLPEWRLPAGSPPVTWAASASVMQLLLTANTVIRTRRWSTRLALRTLAARVALLAVGGFDAPPTRISRGIMPLQVAALLFTAAWRLQRERSEPAKQPVKA
jgi:hypothetical protein